MSHGYYDCDCGGFSLSCGCEARHAKERQAYWAAEHQKNEEAAHAVQCLIDNRDEDDGDRAALERVMTLACQKRLQVKRFAEGKGR